MSEQGQIVKDVEIMNQALIFKFQLKLMPNENLPAPPIDQTIDELKIVSSKTDEKGDSIYDLGGIQQVGEFYVRFKKDAQDKNESFEISLSEDKENWLGKLTGEQQEQAAITLSINPFFSAKYVRFIGQHQLNSIEYVRISGKKLTEPEDLQTKEIPPPFVSGVPDHKAAAEEERKALEDTKIIAEEATDPQVQKNAKETLKKSKKK